MKREPGFYWVRFKIDVDWFIAYHSDYDWYYQGRRYNENDFEIDERRIERSDKDTIDALMNIDIS